MTERPNGFFVRNVENRGGARFEADLLRNNRGKRRKAIRFLTDNLGVLDSADHLRIGTSILDQLVLGIESSDEQSQRVESIVFSYLRFPRMDTGQLLQMQTHYIRALDRLKEHDDPREGGGSVLLDVGISLIPHLAKRIDPDPLLVVFDELLEEKGRIFESHDQTFVVRMQSVRSLAEGQRRMHELTPTERRNLVLLRDQQGRTMRELLEETGVTSPTLREDATVLITQGQMDKAPTWLALPMIDQEVADQILAFVRVGRKNAEIASELQIPIRKLETYITALINDRRMSLRVGGRTEDPDVTLRRDKIVTSVIARDSREKIARALGISRKRLGIEIGILIKEGRLDPEIAKGIPGTPAFILPGNQIKQAIESGVSAPELAHELGVSVSRLRQEIAKLIREEIIDPEIVKRARIARKYQSNS